MVVALTVIAAGCGSDDGGGGGDEQPQGAGSTAAAVSTEVEAAYGRFIDNVQARRFARACADFSAAWRKRYPKAVGIGKTCVQTMTMEFSNAPRDGADPKLSQVKDQGQGRAVALSKTTKDSEGIPLKFVKEGDEWRFDGPVPQGDEAKSGGKTSG